MNLGAPSCLSPAASFIVIEAPRVGAITGILNYQGLNLADAHVGPARRSKGRFFLLLLPISSSFGDLRCGLTGSGFCTGKLVLKLFRCGTEWPTLIDIRLNI